MGRTIEYFYLDSALQTSRRSHAAGYSVHDAPWRWGVQLLPFATGLTLTGETREKLELLAL